MRTLIIHPMLAPYRVDLFNALCNRIDFKVLFQRSELTYHRSLNQVALRKALRCDFGYLGGNCVIMDRDVPFGIFGAVLRIQPQVVVVSEFSLATVFVIALRAMGRRRFGIVIWSDESCERLARHGLARRILRRFCAKRADSILMCSGLVAEAFARAIEVDKRLIYRCAVHQDPVRIRACAEAARETAEMLLDECGIRDKRVVLFVGRLSREKNLHRLLEAFALVARDLPDAILMFVGSGSERASLEMLASNLGVESAVRFLGHCESSRLYGAYRVSAVLVLVSLSEAYGATVNEALICGVPVVSSDRVGAFVLIKPGVNGIVVDSLSVEDIAAGISRFLSCALPAAELLRRMREDLMPVDFNEDVSGFVDAVELAASRARQ